MKTLLTLEKLKPLLLASFLGYLVGMFIAYIDLFGSSQNAPLLCAFGGLALAIFKLKDLNKYWKKHWINLDILLGFIELNLLSIFLKKIPSIPLNNYYINEDVFSFSFNNILLLGVLFLVSMLFLYRYFLDEDKVIKIAKSFVYSIVVVFPLLVAIVFYIGLWINRQDAKQEITQDFIVDYIGRNTIELKSEKRNCSMPRNIFQKEDLSNLKVNDTIHIVFKKGILGVKYMEDGKITLKQ